MTSRMQWFGVGSSVAVLVGLVAGIAAGKSNYKRTDSRSQYVHRIPLYDAQDRPIKPTDPQPSPYSPRNTCKKCHDYQQIAHGYHFGGPSNDDGRPGEPWIWTDRRSGSQIPLSLHKWPGTYRPGDLGLTPVAFAEHFGGHLPGGNLGKPAANADASPAAGGNADGAEKGPSPSRWDVTGELTIDCMLCHAASRQYSYDQWAKQVHRQNFAWAPTAALDLAKIVGVAKNLPDDFDPTANADRAICHPPSTVPACINRLTAAAPGRFGSSGALSMSQLTAASRPSIAACKGCCKFSRESDWPSNSAVACMSAISERIARPSSPSTFLPTRSFA